jgi:hypothetical protein
VPFIVLRVNRVGGKWAKNIPLQIRRKAFLSSHTQSKVPKQAAATQKTSTHQKNEIKNIKAFFPSGRSLSG